MFLLADGAHPALATAGEVLFPMGLWVTYWQPTVTLLLFSVTLYDASVPCLVQVTCTSASCPVYCWETWEDAIF